MDDCVLCPICNDKLITFNYSQVSRFGKTTDYIERVCRKKHDHIICLWTDKKTGQIDILRLFVDPKFSRYLETNFLEQTSYFIAYNDANEEQKVIELGEMIVPDFPLMTQLKKKLANYMAFL
jgi:hypothetical protein